MVRPITGAESYFWGTGKSIKAIELPMYEKVSWRKIAITLSDRS
jgi:hypothetical protein